MWYYILEVSPLAPDYQWDQWWRGEKTSSFPSSFWCARRFFLRFSTSAANLLLLVYIKPATNKGENKNLHIYIQVEKEREKKVIIITERLVFITRRCVTGGGGSLHRSAPPFGSPPLFISSEKWEEKNFLTEKVATVRVPSHEQWTIPPPSGHPAVMRNVEGLERKYLKKWNSLRAIDTKSFRTYPMTVKRAQKKERTQGVDRCELSWKLKSTIIPPWKKKWDGPSVCPPLKAQQNRLSVIMKLYTFSALQGSVGGGVTHTSIAILSCFLRGKFWPFWNWNIRVLRVWRIGGRLVHKIPCFLSISPAVTNLSGEMIKKKEVEKKVMAGGGREEYNHRGDSRKG